MEITSNIKEVIRRFDDIHRKQVPFAMALALNDTAQDVKAAEEAAIEKDLDNPTPFTRRGIYVQRASKNRLYAKIGVKRIQAGYLQRQYRGGERRAKGGAFLIPKRQRVNKYGNIAKGAVRRQKAKANVFVASKSSRRASHLPGGLYQRQRGRNKDKLKLLVSFEDRASYKSRIDYRAVAIKAVRAGFGAHFRRRMVQAIRTAK